MSATTAFQGTPVHLSGEPPAVGDQLPAFRLTGRDLREITGADFAGRPLVISVFPSVDTGICAASVRRFNEAAAAREGVTVLTVSRDLPFALDRFCGAEGIDDAVVASDFRRGFGEALGVVQADGPLESLLARVVLVVDAEGVVIHSQVVDEITTEPDYAAALAALDG